MRSLALAVCALSVAWIAWRRPVIFKLGARNIPRRRTQTVLIVAGLMLSTLIIAAALGTGDTVITSNVKTRFLGANNFNALHVKVVTERGVVYLLGTVTEVEANAATEIARTTDGVKKVVKVFEYCKSGESVCRPLPTPTAEK